MTPVLAILYAAALAPGVASAGFFDFLFGNSEPAAKAPAPQPEASSYADPSAPSAYPNVSAPVSTGSGRFTAFCVRTCDGRYFPISARGGATPAQMCQSFCPASPTKVFSGNSIDYAVANMGERYVDMPNAFAYRKSLKADCTCNGRDSTGLAPVDLSLDTTLRPGDIIATSNGLVAYSGVKTATGQTAEFTPVANYPGLTAEVRAKLGEMKVAPVSAEITDDAPYTSSIPMSSEDRQDALRPLIEQLPPLPTGEFKPAPRAKRADVN
ncbi:MAG: DUF2865 domain-containing protein [Afipia sp.]|nr:DUF2865 domain-containing protein [Afipia sp.]